MNRWRNWGIVAGVVALTQVIAFSYFIGRNTGWHTATERANRVILLKTSHPAGAFLGGREALNWVFSDAMTENAGHTAVSGSVTITPPVAGLARWSQPNVMTFHPDAPWPEGGEIRVRLAPPLSLAGRAFPPAEFRYFGRPPAITEVSRLGEDKIGRTISLRVKLSRPLEADAFRRAFVLDEGTGAVAYAVTTCVSNREYAIRTPALKRNSVQGRFSIRPAPDVPPRVLWEGSFDLVEPMLVKSAELQEERDVFAVKVSFSQPPAPGWSGFLAVEPATNLSVEAGTGAVVRIRGLKSGGEYRLTFKAGLPGLNGSVVTGDLPVALSVPDLNARLKFRDRGHYLSSAGSRKVTLETVNVPAVKVAIWRVYPNNFVNFARSGILYQDTGGGYWEGYRAEQEGEMLTNRVIRPGPGKNLVFHTALSLDEYTGHAEEGVYYLTAEDAADRSCSAQKLVVLTDLGLSAIRHEKEIWVWAASIRKGEPVAGATVSVFSVKNQLVGTVATDESGLARIAADPLPPLSVVTAVKGPQLAMIKLDESLVQGPKDESDQPFLENGYEAFLYADRGIYRPGETARVKAAVRGPLLHCPESFPVQLVVRRPDGAAFARLTAVLTDAGSAEFELPFPAEALTGLYRLALEIPGAARNAGSMSVQVEDFVPPTLAVTVKGPPGRAKPGQPVPVIVEARHLFGRPAAGKRVSLRARIGSQSFQPPQFKEFVFGDPRRSEVWRTVECGEKRLDASGKATFELILPGDLNPAAALSCGVAATVVEDSGRTCPALAAFPVDPRDAYIGLQAVQPDWKAGDTVRFRTVAVQPDGSPAGMELRWSLSRVTWNWREETDEDGNIRFRCDRITESVRDGVLAPIGKPAEVAWEKALEGEYELAVADASGAITASAVFYVAGDQGWSAAGSRQPDRVAVRLDRERYRAGDEAVVSLETPFPGRVLVTLENSRVRWAQVFPVSARALDVRIPVKPDYWPNMHIRAVAVRPLDGGSPSGGVVVARAVGMASMVVTRPEAQFRVELTVPPRVKPLADLETEVRVTDASGTGVVCEVTVSAVDEGILRLTGYRTPDPIGYFGAPRNLAAWLHDVYSLLLPDADGRDPAARMHTGGDAMGAEMAGRLNPVRARRFIPVALWSGTVRTDGNGRARVSMPIPEFSGQLRVTTVAIGRNGFGCADKAVPVRRDWIVQASLPRAAAPGDRFSLGCTVFNESAEAGEIRLLFSGTGPIGLEPGAVAVKTVSLPSSVNGEVAFPLVATGPGVGEVKLRIQAGADQWEERIGIPVRPPWPHLTISGDGSLFPGRFASIGIPVAWFTNTGSARVAYSGLPGLEGMGALNFLSQYPYGCLEQTLSCAYPYLVAEDLMAASGGGLADRGRIGERVGAAIRRVAMMQTVGGGFALWPREWEVYDWGSAYAVLFLAEAKAAGYATPQETLDRGCAYLEQKLGGWLRDLTMPGFPAYAAAAAHALAAAGHPDQAALSRLAGAQSDWDADSRARLVLAFLAAGRRTEAAALLEKLESETPVELSRDSGGALRSAIRREALMLDAWLQIDPASSAIPKHVGNLLKGRRNGQWETTQENACALLALGRYARLQKTGKKECKALLTAPDDAIIEVAEAGELTFPDPQQIRNMTIRNTGEGILYYAWSASGVPLALVSTNEDRGIRIQRTVLDLAGKPLANPSFKQGELAIVQLTVNGMVEPLDNLVIEELLPGGLEIENPALHSAYASFLPSEDDRLSVRYLTVRDDRLIAFTGVAVNGGALCYLVRAVTPGDYIWPPAAVSCMYDPTIHSLKSAGRIRVEP